MYLRHSLFGGRDLVGVFLVDEIVESGLRFEERGIERRLSPVVRMQVVLALGRKRVSGIERIEGREGETAQSCWKQRQRGSLAAPDEKVSAARVSWIRTCREKIDRMPCLPWPTQNGCDIK